MRGRANHLRLSAGSDASLPERLHKILFHPIPKLSHLERLLQKAASPKLKASLLVFFGKIATHHKNRNLNASIFEVYKRPESAVTEETIGEGCQPSSG